MMPIQNLSLGLDFQARKLFLEPGDGARELRQV